MIPQLHPFYCVALLVWLFASSSSGFLLPIRQATNNEYTVNYQNVLTTGSSQRSYSGYQSHLLMTNTSKIVESTNLSTVVVNTEENNENNPLSMFWSSSATSSAYRTFLFCGALFGSRSFREFLGLPVCFLIATASFSLYFYETKFNYLVDVVTPKRQEALKAVKQFKTDQLSSTSSSSKDKDNGSLQDLLNDYQRTLQEELNARVIIPPNIWVIEMDLEQEDRILAPQLLGLEITDKYTLEPTNGQTRSPTEF